MTEYSIPGWGELREVPLPCGPCHKVGNRGPHTLAVTVQPTLGGGLGFALGLG